MWQCAKETVGTSTETRNLAHPWPGMETVSRREGGVVRVDSSSGTSDVLRTHVVWLWLQVRRRRAGCCVKRGWHCTASPDAQVDGVLAVVCTQGAGAWNAFAAQRLPSTYTLTRVVHEDDEGDITWNNVAPRWPVGDRRESRHVRLGERAVGRRR